MVPGVILAGLSYRAAFVLSGILLAASLVLTLVAAAVSPNLWPVSGFAGLTLLLAVTTAFTGWVATHSEPDEEVPRD